MTDQKTSTPRYAGLEQHHELGDGCWNTRATAVVHDRNSDERADQENAHHMPHHPIERHARRQLKFETTTIQNATAPANKVNGNRVSLFKLAPARRKPSVA